MHVEEVLKEHLFNCPSLQVSSDRKYSVVHDLILVVQKPTNKQTTNKPNISSLRFLNRVNFWTKWHSKQQGLYTKCYAKGAPIQKMYAHANTQHHYCY